MYSKVTFTMTILLMVVINIQTGYSQNVESHNISSICTAPGEDASTQMRISWADDNIDDPHSYVVLSEYKDTKWKKSRKFYPSQCELCSVFDSLYSKRADNSDFYENAVFTKCGASLNGLKPDTRYKYYIASKKSKLSEVYSFKTAGAEQWSCCIISDFHSYPPLGKRVVSAMSMIDTVKAFDDSIDWILHLGDICAWGGSWSFWQELYKQNIFKDFFWAGVNGNHDNMSRKYDKQTHLFFKNASFYPDNGYGDQTGVCYHFRYGNTLFIMLNNEAMHSDEGLMAAQQWVRDVVKASDESSNPPQYKVVCEHYQWFYGGDGKTSHYGKWAALFDELGVDLALAGNNHIYVRSGAIYDGKKTDGTYGTVYIQTSSSDNERGQGMKDTLSFNTEFIEKRFTEGNQSVSALDMKVDSEKIIVTLIDRYGSTIDSAIIPAKIK